MDKLPGLIRNSSIWIIIRLAINSVVGLMVTAYIVRCLSVHDYGIYNILFTLMGYIGIATSFGFRDTFNRFLPELESNGNYYALKKLVRSGLLFRLGLSVACVLLVFVFSGSIGGLLQVENLSIYFKIFSIGVITYLEINLLSVVFTSLFLNKYLSICNIIYVLVRAILMLFVVVNNYGLMEILYVEVVMWGLFLLMLLYCYYHKFSKRNPVVEKQDFPVGRFLRYGKFTYFNQMGTSILNVSTDLLIISMFLGPAAVGIYAFANNLINACFRCMPHRALSEVIGPTFFRKYAEKGDKKELVRIFNLLVKLSAFFVVPFAFAVLVLGDKIIIHVFGDKYLSSLSIMWLLVLFGIINVVTISSGTVLKSLERVEVLFYSKIFAVYNLIGDLIVVQKFGIHGVVLVTGSAVILKNYFCFFYAKKYAGLYLDWGGLFGIFLNSAIMGLFLVSIRSLVVNVYMLLIACLAGLMVYLGVAFMNKAFSSEERRAINKVINKPIFCF